MDPTHQVVRQVRRAVLCLLRDIPCLAPEGAARAEHVDARGGRREDEPPRPNSSLPIAPPLRGIGHVRKSFCEIDYSLREPLDVSHVRPLPL
jgi:hypothetical protein